MTASKLTGVSSPERTLDQKDLAALRPAAPPRPRKPRTAPPLREVTSGIVCFCGERFGEAQSLEFMLHLRAEVGEDLALLDRWRRSRREGQRRRLSDPEYRARHVAQGNKSRRERMADPEYRARVNAQRRERMADPEKRARKNTQNRERLADPEVRARKNAQEREKRAADPEKRARKNTQRREQRRAADPELREQENAQRRERYAGKKAEQS